MFHEKRSSRISSHENDDSKSCFRSPRRATFAKVILFVITLRGHGRVRTCHETRVQMLEEKRKDRRGEIKEGK